MPYLQDVLPNVAWKRKRRFWYVMRPLLLFDELGRRVRSWIERMSAMLHQTLRWDLRCDVSDGSFLCIQKWMEE